MRNPESQMRSTYLCRKRCTPLKYLRQPEPCKLWVIFQWVGRGVWLLHFCWLLFFQLWVTLGQATNSVINIYRPYCGLRRLCGRVLSWIPETSPASWLLSLGPLHPSFQTASCNSPQAATLCSQSALGHIHVRHSHHMAHLDISWPRISSLGEILKHNNTTHRQVLEHLMQIWEDAQ